MENMLLEWALNAKQSLEQRGYTLSINKPAIQQHGITVDLDSKDFVGGIVYWKPDLFEFHFIDMQTEKDILLETANLDSIGELNSYILKMLSEKLPLPDKSKS